MKKLTQELYFLNMIFKEILNQMSVIKIWISSQSWRNDMQKRRREYVTQMWGQETTILEVK